MLQMAVDDARPPGHRRVQYDPRDALDDARRAAPDDHPGARAAREGRHHFSGSRPAPDRGSPRARVGVVRVLSYGENHLRSAAPGATLSRAASISHAFARKRTAVL